LDKPIESIGLGFFFGGAVEKPKKAIDVEG